MNYFAHAIPFLNDPYFVAGTAVPDWLSVVDRRVRVRAKHAEPFVGGPDHRLASLAGGVLQHIRDDAHFHETRAFAETSLELTGRARDALGRETGFRPSLLGHLLVEVLLDASLIGDDPARLDAYYGVLDAVDAAWVEAAISRIAPRPCVRLALMIERFRRERILWDYLDDAKLLTRLNQVMRRVRFAPLPDEFRDLLPPAREIVDGRKDVLLGGIPAL
jgi:hypothetical protein